MKMSNLLFLKLLLFTTIIFFACGKSLDAEDLVGSWVVSYYIIEGEKINKSEDNTWMNSNNGDITLQFEELDNNGEGDLSGITVTNENWGKYSIPSDGHLSILLYGGTEIAEPEWTDHFKLYEIEEFEIKDEKLFLYYHEKNNIIVLDKL